MAFWLATVFLGAAALALGFAMYALWRSLRGVFGVADDVDASYSHLGKRRALEEEKDSLLANLQELGFDRDAGKISDEDYRALETKARARAKEVLRELDADLGEHRGKAEALIAERVREVSAGAPSKPEKPTP